MNYWVSESVKTLLLERLPPLKTKFFSVMSIAQGFIRPRSRSFNPKNPDSKKGVWLWDVRAQRHLGEAQGSYGPNILLPHASTNTFASSHWWSELILTQIRFKLGLSWRWCWDVFVFGPCPRKKQHPPVIHVFRNTKCSMKMKPLIEASDGS